MERALRRLRFWAFILTGAGLFFVVLSFMTDYEGPDAGPSGIDRLFGTALVGLGCLLGWLGFADEAGTVGNYRLRQATLLCALGAAVGGVIGFVTGLFV